MIRRLEQADELFSRGMSSLVISMTMLAHAAILKVKGTAEATLDSTLLTKLTEKQYKMVRDMKAGSSAFDTTMFVERLFTFMGGRANVSLEAARDDEFNAEIDDDDDPTVPLLWGKIGQLALSKSRRVPTTTFMYVLIYLTLFIILRRPGSGLVLSRLKRRNGPLPNAPSLRRTRKTCENLNKSPKRISRVPRMRQQRTWPLFVLLSLGNV